LFAGAHDHLRATGSFLAAFEQTEEEYQPDLSKADVKTGFKEEEEGTILIIKLIGSCVYQRLS